jgi:hypothetical protein
MENSGFGELALQFGAEMAECLLQEDLYESAPPFSHPWRTHHQVHHGHGEYHLVLYLSPAYFSSPYHQVSYPN